ncbi:MAG: methyltransferase domain-containing protein [Bacteriovorax sp.]|nr:methyltransferase domain-containing protein [Bacteriovorax sp.]
MSNDLTTEDFWANYWATLSLPVKVDMGFKNDRVIANEILRVINKSDKTTALEIGCAPGKWLSFLATELQCKVTGIEYIPLAASKTIENLELQNIKNYRVITGDFFNHQLNEKFDIVLSLGFIEHFENYESVLKNQMDLVKDDGYLIIGIPRFVGINFYLQKIIDQFIENKLIPGHNLKTMQLKNFSKFGKKYNLKIISNKYIGGFEHGLFPVAEIKNSLVRVIVKIAMRILKWTFGKINSNFTSSYQIAIYKK